MCDHYLQVQNSTIIQQVYWMKPLFEPQIVRTCGRSGGTPYPSYWSGEVYRFCHQHEKRLLSYLNDCMGPEFAVMGEEHAFYRHFHGVYDGNDRLHGFYEALHDGSDWEMTEDLRWLSHHVEAYVDRMIDEHVRAVLVRLARCVVDAVDIASVKSEYSVGDVLKAYSDNVERLRGLSTQNFDDVVLKPLLTPRRLRVVPKEKNE